MARHPATSAAILVAILASSGCFEWGPTQPPLPTVKEAAKDQSWLDSADDPPKVSEVAHQLNHHEEPEAQTTDEPAPNTSAPLIYSGGGGGGGGGFSASTVTITDVQYQGQSVVGPNSPATLVGDLEGAPVQLTVTGSGFAYPEDFKNIATKFTVPMDPAYLAQTFIGNPKSRVLLDNTIALQPTDGGTFSANRLDVTLSRKAVLDLMLAGEHTLSVTVGFNKAIAKVRFSAPTVSQSLAPKITSAKLVKAVDDETDTSEWLIELKGSNFFLDFRKAYCKLNDRRAYWHASYVGATESIGYVHVPEGSLQGPGKNSLTVISPFGIAMANL